MAENYRELDGKNILLVEGEPWARDSLSLFLRTGGCNLHVAGSATEAMEALSACKFDFIICEYWLPDLDGMSFLKTLGNGHPGTVKILTSSYLPAQAMDGTMCPGIIEVIRPPFTMDLLRRALTRNRPPHGTREFRG